MALGVALGYVAPDLIAAINAATHIGTTSLPLAVGLILMMYPPLARVRYEEMGRAFKDRRLVALALIQNWIAGPVVMTALAVLFLHGQPEYIIGVTLVGLARCIAMVIVWNELAQGDREFAVGLVALNAIFQMLFYAAYIYLFVEVILKSLGLVPELEVSVSMWDAAKTVLIYLGIPFFAGMGTRYGLIAARGREWYDRHFAPRIAPITLVALLFTIVVMFSMQGEKIVQQPLAVILVALPMTCYFFLMWFITFLIAYRLGVGYRQAAAVSFTAASNDFELAIAVAVGIFGITSKQAFATVIGPLVEVPVLISLVNVSLLLRQRLYPHEAAEEKTVVEANPV